MSYDMISETNAANYLARRSLEDLRPSKGKYRGHAIMLEAVTQGAVPSISFKPGNAKYDICGKRGI